MENRSSYTIVGIFVMLCLAFFGAFMWWMATKTDPNEAYRSYFIHTKNLPTGIKENSEVRFLGVNAGIIKKIDFADVANGIIEIEISVKKKLPISKDSVAEIETQGLTGISHLNITRGSGELFDEFDEKPIIALDKTLLDKIGSKAEIITDSVGEMILKINTLMSQENIEKLNLTLSNLEKFSANLQNDERFKNIDSIISNADKIVADLSQREKDLDEVLKNFNTFAKSATNFANAMNKTQSMMAKRIEQGDYNLKAILDPTLSEAKVTLIEFNRALREFQGALFRLEDNPYEFFFRDTKKEKR